MICRATMKHWAGCLAGVAMSAGCSVWMPAEGPLAQTAETPEDAAVSDAGIGVAYTGPPLNGCTALTFVDRTAAGADRTIYFGGVGGSGATSYSPPCMQIAAGQTVTWSGAFPSHPLTPGTSPLATTAGSPHNPIVSQANNGGNTYTVSFPQKGTYPFVCGVHFALGMIGAVEVE